jgi:hypothetical protein
MRSYILGIHYLHPPLIFYLHNSTTRTRSGASRWATNMGVVKGIPPTPTVPISRLTNHFPFLPPQFTEHVGRNYQPNYLTAWRKAALIFMTHSKWGGWHHVEVHDDPWWIVRMQAMGYVYSDFLTQQARTKGKEDRWLVITNPRNESDQKSYFTGQHIGMSMLVRIVNIFLPGFRLSCTCISHTELNTWHVSDFRVHCIIAHLGIHQSSCCI